MASDESWYEWCTNNIFERGGADPLPDEAAQSVPSEAEGIPEDRHVPDWICDVFDNMPKVVSPVDSRWIRDNFNDALDRLPRKNY